MSLVLASDIGQQHRSVTSAGRPVNPATVCSSRPTQAHAQHLDQKTQAASWCALKPEHGLRVCTEAALMVFRITTPNDVASSSAGRHVRRRVSLCTSILARIILLLITPTHAISSAGYRPLELHAASACAPTPTQFEQRRYEGIWLSRGLSEQAQVHTCHCFSLAASALQATYLKKRRVGSTSCSPM